MIRVKRCNIARKKHKKIFKVTKGIYGSSSNLVKDRNQQKLKVLKFSYRDRNSRKRDFRSVWITRLNSAVHFYNKNYSFFFKNFKKSKIIINRKTLAQMSLCDQKVFNELIIFYV